MNRVAALLVPEFLSSPKDDEAPDTDLPAGTWHGDEEDADLPGGTWH